MIAGDNDTNAIPVTNAVGAARKLADLTKLDRLALTLTESEDVAAIQIENDLDV